MSKGRESMLRTFGGAVAGMLSPSAQRRYESKHILLAGLARWWGLRVYNRNLAWFHDQEYLACWASFPGAGSDRGRVHDRRFVLFQLAKAVAGMGHDTAECGVLYGAGSHLICSAIGARGRVGPPHHLVFDSFEGLSEPKDIDVPMARRTFRWRRNDLSVPESIVRENLSAFDFVRYYKGWIPSRFNEVEDHQFSLVHVDVDLYQPTLDAFTFFYPRLVRGGILICDDYGSEACPGALQAVNDFMATKPEKVVHLPTGQGVVFRQ